MPNSPLRTPHDSSAAFTLVEVLVVMLIVAIMIGIGMVGLSSTRKSSNSVNAMSAASAYVDAIAGFQLAHGGRAPQMGSADWPTGSTAQRNAGPINAGNGKKPYIRSVPESVSSGAVVVAPRGSSLTGGASSARILYATIGTASNTTKYALIVQKRIGSKLVDSCVFTNSPTDAHSLTTAKAC